jgi:hypothetical protein
LPAIRFSVPHSAAGTSCDALGGAWGALDAGWALGAARAVLDTGWGAWARAFDATRDSKNALKARRQRDLMNRIPRLKPREKTKSDFKARGA